MKENKTLRINNNYDETAKVEALVLEFCKKHRVYDEYFASMLRSVDIIVRKIMTSNKEKDGQIDIRLSYNEREVIIEFITSTNMVAAFTPGSSKEDEALRQLVNELEISDSNKLHITFYINSLHQQEWVRRRQLLNNYYQKSKKEA